MIVHPREIHEPAQYADQRAQEHVVEQIQQRHRPAASNFISSASASAMLAVAGSSSSAPGCSTPSALLTAGGTTCPLTLVPHELTSWMKNRPFPSRRIRKCSRETFAVVITCTSTHAALPLRPTDSESLRMLNTCAP